MCFNYFRLFPFHIRRCSFIAHHTTNQCSFHAFASTYDCNVRLRELGRRGDVHAARELFDEMPERDKVSYASLIGIYLKHDQLHSAEQIFSEIPPGMRSIVADSAMIHGYARAGRMDRADEIFEEMPCRNSFSWTSLISGYFSLGKVDRAVKLFGKMPEREKNGFTWTAMILGYSQNGMIDDARAAFDRMPVKNVVAWTSMIKACVDCNHVEQALEIFHMMPERNLYSWNIVIRGLLDVNRISEAIKLFDSMPWRNSISWTNMLTGLARNGMTNLARKYFDQIPTKDIVAWNAMITAYTDEGCLAEASELFNIMSYRNTLTWNAMIDGYAKHGCEDESFKHFLFMLRNGIRPNEASLVGFLISCTTILGVCQAHALIVRFGFETETSLANTLITAYNRSGDIFAARIVFNNLEVKDVVTWTVMILACSNHGFGEQALQAFGLMLRSGHEPGEITFVGVLSACSHAGLVRKGEMLFDSIKRGYGLELRGEHYCCLVDILGRAGRLNDAVKVVQTMPLEKYDGAVFGALLGACMLHGNVELAEWVGSKLIELEPAGSDGYGSLANVYAASGKWDRFLVLKRKMKEMNVKKVPGCSQIEVNGKNHLFFAGDRSHPEMVDTRSFLEEKLLPVMQDTADLYSFVLSVKHNFCMI